MNKYLFSLLLSLFTVGIINAQDVKMPAPSPLSTIKQDFSTSHIEVVYSRPSARDRKVFGGLVPYGQLWRTGANATTKITFGEDITIKGKEVKAGTYALYSIPGEKEWEFIINKGTGNWGANGLKQEEDVLRFKATPIKNTNKVETFTFNIDNITINSCDVVLTWDNTLVKFTVKADNDKRITDYLENSINNPKLPYQQAANYYLETGKNLDKAAIYADKAIEANPTAFWLYWLKARIHQKQGNKSAAIAAAEKTAAMAKGTPYEEEYRRNADGLIKSMK